MGGGSKSGSDQVIGYRYYLSLLMGICRGPINEIVSIRVGDMRAWPVPEQNLSKRTALYGKIAAMLIGEGETRKPEQLVTVAEGPNGTGVAQFANGTRLALTADDVISARFNLSYYVNAPELFGGDEREGGVQGSLFLAKGWGGQDYTSEYASKGVPGRIPGFRGVVTLLFDGLICSMNPYPKPWSYRVRRTSEGWDGAVWRPELVDIWMRNGMIRAMNPIHILYECFTNSAWGRGYPRHVLDDANWTAAAQKLHDENFGLCLKFTRQTKLSEFIKVVMDHVGMSLYTDRTTGLICIKLIRDDYVESELPHFTYGTGLLSIEEDEAISQESLINEVIVNWFDPIAQRPRETRAHNLALQQGMAGKNTAKREYPGAPTADLGGKLAQRDLRAASIPLRRYKLRFDRAARNLVPGSPFRISAPDRSMDNIILRAGAVDDRDPSGMIAVTAVADVFGMPQTTYLDGPVNEYVQPDRALTFPTRRRLTEATYADLYSVIDRANLGQIAADTGFIATLASRPTDMSLRYNVVSRAQGQNGFPNNGRGAFLPSVVIQGTIAPNQTVLPFTGGVDVGLVRVGMAVLIGNEICRLDEITTSDSKTGTITVARGTIDTIPLEHAAGRTAFFYRLGQQGRDGVEYSRNEIVEAKILTATSSGVLEAEDTPLDSITIAARQSRPYPPGNVRVNGSLVINGSRSVSDTMTLTWAHRNRLLIKDQLLGHSEPGVGQEAGTTYQVKVFTGSTLRGTYDGITGASWNYTSEMRGNDGVSGRATFEFTAFRDGLASNATYRFDVVF